MKLLESFEALTGKRIVRVCQYEADYAGQWFALWCDDDSVLVFETAEREVLREIPTGQVLSCALGFGCTPEAEQFLTDKYSKEKQGRATD